MKKRAAFATLLLTFVSTLVVMPLASARGMENESEDRDGSRRVLSESVATNVEKFQTAIEHRLEDHKLRACKVHAVKINGYMRGSLNRVVHQDAAFDKIYTRVANFYVKKGKVVAGYEAAAAKVEAAQAKVDADIAKLKTYDRFSCDSSDPRGFTTAYRADVKTAKDDLKVYRKALRDLIVLVKSAQKES